MDIKQAMSETLQKLENLKEPIQSLQGSSKPSLTTEELKKRIPSSMAAYDIPKKFITMDFKRPDFISLDMVNKGICLTGKAGVGKTTALCLLVRDWLLESTEKLLPGTWVSSISKKWSFISFPEFIMEVQDSFKSPPIRYNEWGSKVEMTAFDLLSEIANKPYLIIDDLGAEKPTEYVRQATYYIINHREMHMLPTFITTNFSMDHLDENIDSRISSRICGMCDVLRFEGKDRRLKS